jgi:O-acetyl-ADP-ribose deacetylase (regulator of RNase III)
VTLNTDARNVIAAAYADTFDRLVLLDGATVIGTATVALVAGATGVVTVDPASVTYVADGTIDGAKYASSTGSEEAALTVSTVAAGTGEVQISQLTAVSGETVNFTVASITVPAS